MRQEQTVRLDEARTVAVRELRLRDVRRLVAQLKDKLVDFDVINDLFGEKFDELMAMAGDCVTMPDGETIDELTFSELDAVVEAFKEVNASFLAKLAAMGLNLELLVPTAPPEVSIEQPSSSSSADTGTSGTTAGDSSPPVANGSKSRGNEATE